MATTFEGSLDGAGLRIAIVAARFNEKITSRLVSEAQRELGERGVAEGDVDLAWVPGAFELPFAARKLAESHRYDAVICLGAVIRGETSHDQYVSGEAGRGVADVARDTGVPAIFGVITPNTMEQAIARADGTKANKGAEAALSAIEMANLTRRLRPD